MLEPTNQTNKQKKSFTLQIGLCWGHFFNISMVVYNSTLALTSFLLRPWRSGRCENLRSSLIFSECFFHPRNVCKLPYSLDYARTFHSLFPQVSPSPASFFLIFLVCFFLASTVISCLRWQQLTHLPLIAFNKYCSWNLAMLRKSPYDIKTKAVFSWSLRELPHRSKHSIIVL